MMLTIPEEIAKWVIAAVDVYARVYAGTKRQREALKDWSTEAKRIMKVRQEDKKRADRKLTESQTNFLDSS